MRRGAVHLLAGGIYPWDKLGKGEACCVHSFVEPHTKRVYEKLQGE